MGRILVTSVLLVLLVTALTASAASLEVDGGVLQVYRLRADIELPPATLDAVVDIEPETLEQKSQGQPVIVFIDLPDEFDERAIDGGSLRLCRGSDPCADGVPPGSPPPAVVAGGRLRVGFDRASVVALVADVTPPETVVFTVSGRLSSGRSFSGSDTVMVVSPGGRLSAPSSAGPGSTQDGSPASPVSEPPVEEPAPETSSQGTGTGSQSSQSALDAVGTPTPGPEASPVPQGDPNTTPGDDGEAATGTEAEPAEQPEGSAGAQHDGQVERPDDMEPVTVPAGETSDAGADLAEPGAEGDVAGLEPDLPAPDGGEHDR